jgi:putative transposase
VSRSKPRPNSLRLQGHNYTEAGAYFVTVVMYGREAILGNVIDRQIKLSQYGSVVANVWKDLPNRYRCVALDEFIIMPDHIHGIIWIHDQPKTFTPNHTVGAGSLLTANVESDNEMLNKTNKPAPDSQQNTLHGGLPRAGYKSTAKQIVNCLGSQSVNEPAPTNIIIALSEIVRNFKTVSAKRINLLRKLPNTPVWQRGFHDRVIRDEKELNAVRQYIQSNPQRWGENQPL